MNFTFLPNGGHSLGFMDVKMCELQEILNSISRNSPIWPDFQSAYEIEKVMQAIDNSSQTMQWEDVKD